MVFMTFHSVGNVIIPTDEIIFFRGVGSTTNRSSLFLSFGGASTTNASGNLMKSERQWPRSGSPTPCSCIWQRRPTTQRRWLGRRFCRRRRPIRCGCQRRFRWIYGDPRGLMVDLWWILWWIYLDMMMIYTDTYYTDSPSKMV